MKQDTKFMAQAITLAKKGYPYSYPNPMVGAIIVKNGKIIGKGYHKKYGGPHAEIEAISSVKNKKDLVGSTIYITLEPCNHHGKTGPCTISILNSCIKKVVFGSNDPYKSKATKESGAKFLKRHGINVIGGVLEQKCIDINREFFAIHKEKRPSITAKIACSIDGGIALNNGESKWITNEKARKNGRDLRGEVDAILVGVGTVLADNPLLTTRQKSKKDPIRIVLDPNNKTPKDAKVLNGDAKTILVSSEGFSFFGFNNYLNPNLPTKKLISQNYKNNYNFNKNGRLVESCGTKKRKLFALDTLVQNLFKLGIKSILIEGGPTTITHFLKQDLIDRIIIYKGNKILGEDSKKMIGRLGLEKLENSIKLNHLKTKVIGDNIRSDYIIGS